MFQFRCGFSVPCDWLKSDPGLIDDTVSIPLWIFCSLRPATFERRCSRSSVSIPLWIFCSLRHRIQFIGVLGKRLFQFRCGFSVPCDCVTKHFSPTAKVVSIPLWIFCSLRPAFASIGIGLFNRFQFRCGFSVPCDPVGPLRSFQRWPVSIPLWIFCSLRLDCGIYFREDKGDDDDVSIPLWIFCSLRHPTGP